MWSYFRGDLLHTQFVEKIFGEDTLDPPHALKLTGLEIAVTDGRARSLIY